MVGSRGGGVWGWGGSCTVVVRVWGFRCGGDSKGLGWWGLEVVGVQGWWGSRSGVGLEVVGMVGVWGVRV